MKHRAMTLLMSLTLAMGMFGVLPVFSESEAPLAAIVLTGGGSYSQDFDSLASTGTSSTVPNGWAFLETGSNANASYSAGTGSSNTGDTYSFGSTSTVERAFGGLASNNLASTIGVEFQNGTGKTILSLSIVYNCEQWRLGGSSQLDRMDFQYSTDATSLNTGTWIDVNLLDCSSTVTSGTTGALDGNNAANRTNVSAAISSLNIADSSTFWLRWADVNISGADDGLAVDDLSINSTLAVTLASFDAAQQGDYILVSWETVSELDNAGFNLYRSDSAAGPQTLLAYIPSQAPGSAQGFAYSYQDTDVQPGQTWWYWLEDISLGGATTLHGPVSATVQAPTAVTLGGVQASPAAAAPVLPWLWVVAVAGAALGFVWRRRKFIV